MTRVNNTSMPPSTWSCAFKYGTNIVTTFTLAPIVSQAQNVGNKSDYSNTTVLLDNPNRPTLAYPNALAFLFVFTTLLVGVIVRGLMLWISMCIPYRVVMFAIGALLGTVRMCTLLLNRLSGCVLSMLT